MPLTSTNAENAVSHPAPALHRSEQPANAKSGHAEGSVATTDDAGIEDSSESEEDDEEDDEESDEDPVDDICGELEEILTGDLKFTGAFSFNKTYSSAPNPALEVEGLGTIGLPLSTRDAAAIKAHAAQAPFGKADKTVIDRTVRDTWEIDANQIRFQNASWATFMDTTVREVCQVLGINFEASKPVCELYKLLLYETGSHFLPHVDTEKVNGMFATMVVILPSRFTGGGVRVKHGELTNTYDSSANSLTNTTVLAWYTDVEHEVQAVTSGYRLALSFDLIHTTNSLRPTLSESTLPARLLRVLLSWKKGEGDAPTKVVYLLSHKYSHANLRGSALKGVDAHLVALLENAATPHGFHLGLANLTCTERGTADDYGGGYRHGWGRRCYYDEWDSRDADVDMEEVEDTSVDIKHLVDLDGRLIKESVNCDLEAEAIPQSLVEVVTSGAFDKQEYEGYQGNYAGSLERFYRRTVLVIWPPWANFDMVHGANGFDYACRRISASTSTQPTAEELELAEIILTRATLSQAAAVISSVCRAAITWGDVTLWLRAVLTCDAERSIATLQDRNILDALKKFGFAKIRARLECALERDPSNVGVLQFLERFESWISAWAASEHSDTMQSWVLTQREKRLNNLKTPSKDELKLLSALIARYKGVDFLENKLVPLVKETRDSALLLEFAKQISEEETLPADARSQMARELLKSSLTHMDFYAPIPAKKAIAPTYFWQSRTKPAEEPEQLERAKPYLTLCLALDDVELISLAVEKLLRINGQSADITFRRIKDVLLPLVSFAQDASGPRPGHPSQNALQKLSTTAASLFLQALIANSSIILPGDVSSLVEVMISSGRAGDVISEAVPKLEQLKPDATIIRSLIEVLHSKTAQIDTSGATVREVNLRLLKKYADSIVLTNAGYYARTPAAGVKPAIDALDLCFSVELPEACGFVFERLLRPPNLNVAYISTYLGSLVPELRALLAKHKTSISVEPFASTFRTIMLYWVQHVMGPRPADTSATYLNALKSWTCNCNICPAVRTFLTSKPEDSFSWQRIGAPTRRHVESFLTSHARAIATFDTIRTTPQGLQVKKSQVIVGPARWNHNQKEGYKLLSSISTNVGELQKVLGAECAKIFAAFGIKNPNTVASGPSASKSAPVANVGNARPAQAATARPAAPAATNAPAATSSNPPQNPATQRPISTAPGPAAHAVPTATATRSPAPATEQPPTKRRKLDYNAQDVIDLT
ncbi:hypothetical protein FKP32DRAFT_1595275 [Trametes sanguinea]|nr:hypothetical protein FKP32DRAFT_1595275 [Trametes sanguinea]